MRKMGGLQYRLPITYWTFVIGALAISGVPGFSGFFSKDEILLNAFVKEPILWLIAFVTAGMTVLYIWRVVFLTFHGESRLDHHTEQHAHESPPVMHWPLIILAALAIVGGYVGLPTILGGSNRFEHFLSPVFGETALHVDASTEWTAMILAIAMTVVALVVAYYAYILRPELPGRVAKAFGSFYTLVYNKYYVDELYVAVIVEPLKKLANWLAWVLDVRVIDGAVNGLASVVAWCGRQLRTVQSGFVRGYALSILGGAVILLVYILLR
jgi:NADH-quinone oxidoreductase subunit L